MRSLAELPLKQAYHKPEDDIAQSFYLPCLARSIAYDRAVGFFSSAIYALAWASLVEFVDQNGKIRMICSPVLADADVDAMSEGYAARSDVRQGELISAEMHRLLRTPGSVKPARVLASLVALGVVDIRIAWVGDVVGGQPKRLFHDKVGIFRDGFGNTLAFKGSMNETWPGLALDGNLESVDVYLSWAGEREHARILDEQNYFNRLWASDFPGVVTIPLPQVAREALISASDPEHWRELVQDICVEIRAASQWSPEATSSGRVPRPHQVAALDAWRDRGRRGILEHATGSGKTFTALCAIKDSFARDEVALVIVPSDLLLQQWAAELRTTFGSMGLRLLVCGGGQADWRHQDRLSMWTRPRAGTAPRAVLATLQTASTPEFIEQCHADGHLFMVADEVHRLGATQARRVLELQCGPRLGLSATPSRAGDPIGTAVILEYFEGIVPPPFTLFDAVRAGALTPYAYHVHSIVLEPDEQQLWAKFTRDIARLYAQTQSQGADEEASLRMKRLLIQRARIVKSARQKIRAAVSVINTTYEPGQRWIVYCDDQVQLSQVRDGLRLVGSRDVLEYHTAMEGDPRRTLDLFDAHGGVVVSIRCLDEGVDIPAVTHALILASSKNPREYIQRRGRVLRRAEGKSLAHIHDVLVTPLFDPNEPAAVAILEGELARAIEFGSHAINPGCITDLQRLAIEHGLDAKKLVTVGVELEEVEDTNE